MALANNPLLLEKIRRLGRSLIFLVIGIGALVLIGWTFDIEFIKRPIPSLASMNPTSAFLFLLSGSAFLCFWPGQHSNVLKLTGYILIGGVFTIALVRLLDAMAGFHNHIDLFLFAEKQNKEVLGKYSNRMALHTASCFVLLSIAVPLVNTRLSKRIMPAQVIALGISLLALLSVLGCVYRVQAFYMAMAYIPMAIHTAIGFLCLSLAIFFANPDKGIMSEFAGPLSGSQTARRLIPAAILIPMLLGYFRLLGHWAGLFSTEFGVAILMLSIIVVFVILIWFNSVSLNKKDALRIEAEQRLKISLQQLKESEEKFQKAFQSSSAGMSITRMSDATYVEVNDAFARMTGYTREELIGSSSTKLNFVVNMDKREEVLRQVKEYGRAEQFELTVRHKSGKTLEILSSVETALLGGEKHAVNIIFDITDRKLAEAQLHAVNKELEAFTYSVSHDLRAPLRAIDGYAKMLEEDHEHSLNAEGIGFLRVIQYNARKMSSLIDDLLAFSRLGRKTIHKANLDMNELVATVLADLADTVGNAVIKVTALHPAKGDPALIKQVFVNLISNAIKYSSKKENPLIAISSELKEKEVIYTITDNGEGFNMAYVDKLFGVFQRLHSDEEFEGTGVGLAIVHRIISKHGGRVWASGEQGQGATFSFALPTT